MQKEIQIKVPSLSNLEKKYTNIYNKNAKKVYSLGRADIVTRFKPSKQITSHRSYLFFKKGARAFRIIGKFYDKSH